MVHRRAARAGVQGRGAAHAGVWIVEIAELNAIGRAEVSRIKAFLTRTTDRFRPPYGRYTVEVPRQCVFAGTVNPDTYLRDETGNRRFGRCAAAPDVAALARDRDQLWVEAVHLFRSGTIWWIDDPALLADAREAQDRRYQSDAWDDLIEHWLTHEIRTVSDGYPDYGNCRTESVPRAVPLSHVSVGEILEKATGLEPARWTRGDQMRMSAYLKRTVGNGTGAATRAGGKRRGSGDIGELRDRPYRRRQTAPNRTVELGPWRCRTQPKADLDRELNRCITVFGEGHLQS
ncbi:virulence-associated E family protein [Paracoccus sp. Z118]|nr:virulence-associated E family protein [Paracoccus sp. Z118]